MRKQSALLSLVAAGVLAVFGSAGAVTHPAPSVTVGIPAATTGTAAAPSAGPNLSPLQAMVDPLTTTSHNVVMTTQGSSVIGSVDPANGAAKAVAKSSGLEIDQVVRHGSVWIRANLGPELNKVAGITPGVWMRFNPRQIKPKNELLVQPDGSHFVDVQGIMTGITTLKRVDAQHVRGTIDLTKVTGHTVPDPNEVAKSGAAARQVPFTATADSSGRIIEFTVDADAFDPVLSLRVVFSDYGSADPIEVPAKSIPAPQSVYAVFND